MGFSHCSHEQTCLDIVIAWTWLLVVVLVATLPLAALAFENRIASAANIV